MAAAKAMLDELPSSISQPQSDRKIYTLGSIGGRNVVIASLPAGLAGTISATAVVSRLVSTYPTIQFRLIVGIGGRFPRRNSDICFGDVVVSRRTATSGRFIQYDYDKTLRNGQFQHTGSLKKPRPVLLKATAQIESDSILGRNLLVLGYNHSNRENDGSECDKLQLLDRPQRSDEEPYIHYGLIASGDQVVKDAKTRDSVAHDRDILCFETKAAGLIDELPTLYM
ncbi:hypothetical protein ABOM_003832 [Aspergillus bombycis]|uniref:Nucleoside phosphorylase domain-containing protein n=1 Tax=Aspergillus bombycis TaxID=109264 RepID=A0A1F8A7R0_9EURO|nr:hypothetical protein ABOM_003832 [Aspergillus bombycis]OGM47328.1 hypothetical protein ABOM_003832 [Aspergillus bombycis]